MTDSIFVNAWDDFIVVNSFSNDLFENMKMIRDKNLPFNILEEYFVELFAEETPSDFTEALFRLRVVENEKRTFYCFFTCLSQKLSHDQIQKLVSIVPQYGYWKDLLEIYNYSTMHNMNIILLSCILDKFAEQLKEDKDKENKDTISYAGKWAPREKSKYDKEHKLASKLANLVFPNDNHNDSLKKYRKLIVELTNKKNVIEPKMTANQWDDVSNCLFTEQNSIKYKKAIEKRDLNCTTMQNSRMDFDTIIKLHPIFTIFE